MLMDRVRFLNLWGRCCDSASTAEPIIDEIEARYSEPHRYYHTGQHIDHCLKQFDLARHEMDGADAIELALWFHDIEYDPEARDNEYQSAERFKQIAHGVMDRTLEEQVYRLIMITMHNDAPADTDEQYIVDIDLSSFGLPWDEFVHDSENVHKEYSHLSTEEYVRRNRRFLQSLLDRPEIFFTEFFRERYEQIARDNISKQLLRLDSL